VRPAAALGALLLVIVGLDIAISGSLVLVLIQIAVVVLVAVAIVRMALGRRTLERERFRSQMIAEVGTVMSGALDYELALTELARLISRRLADWCFVFTVEEDGSIRQLAAAHVDIERQSQAWELLYRYPLDRDRPEGPAKVIRTGRADFQPAVTEDLLRAISANDENLELLRALQLRSSMIAPLVARGRILGAIVFASAESGQVFTRRDLELAEEVTARAAITLDNARLYARLSNTERELRTSRDQLQAIVDGVADAVTAQDPAGTLVYANDAAAELLGFDTAEELLEADPAEVMGSYEIIDADGRPFPYDRLPGRQALRGEDPDPVLLRYRNRVTGMERWSQIKATTIRDEAGAPALAINVVEDVTEHRVRELRQRFLAEVGRVLGSSLDIDETFPQVAALAARQLGDWCSIEVLEPDGSARVAGFAHAGPDPQPPVEELLRRHPLTRASYLRQPLVGAELIPNLTEDQVASLARDPERESLLSRLRPRSSMSVPLRVRGRTLGAIGILTAESGRRLTEDDLALAEELAARCALALDNARLYEERSLIARTLQESLLPPLLPDLPGLDVAARFRAAGEGIEVGGDFYDLFELGDAGWAVAIGDVCGKGSGAAAVTALARYTVRAAAMRQDGPSQILALLNEALLRQQSDRRFCTVLYGQLSTNGTGPEFRFASGGHPLPLLLRASGGAEVGAPGTLLGIVPDPQLTDSRVALEAGDAVVLYTDGVTDAAAPRHIWTAQELATEVGSPAGVSASDLADRMMAAALEATPGEPRDDIAIIVLKVPDAA
jgi:PAS domain S-box-containing protein